MMMPEFLSSRRYFYPRPPRGGRPETEIEAVLQKGLFLSTPSARRATVDRHCPGPCLIISIHALREEGDKWGTDLRYFYCGISIHALREEGDQRRQLRKAHLLISIHALREEGDLLCQFITSKLKLFLSTPSARRATAKTETKSLFSNKLYNILHEFRRALIYNGSKNYPNHAK